jgi:hypothetical protein
MRKGLFLGALLATMLVGGTAFAERNDESSSKYGNRGRNIKEQVLEKMKEGYKGRTSSRSDTFRRDAKQDMVKGLPRQKGDVYGDQGTRLGASKMSTAAGKNMSASGRVNTPAEVKAMLKMIHPMFGAYRTSQADSGTDSYGGNALSPVSAGSKGSSGQVKNRSASGKVNTPVEILKMRQMISPLNAVAVTAQGGGTDSYSETEASYTRLMNNGKGAQRHVHFKNEKGEVIGGAKASTDTAAKSKASREKLTKMVSEKIAKTKTTTETKLMKGRTD